MVEGLESNTLDLGPSVEGRLAPLFFFSKGPTFWKVEHFSGNWLLFWHLVVRGRDLKFRPWLLTWNPFLFWDSRVKKKVYPHFQVRKNADVSLTFWDCTIIRMEIFQITIILYQITKSYFFFSDISVSSSDSLQTFWIRLLMRSLWSFRGWKSQDMKSKKTPLTFRLQLNLFYPHFFSLNFKGSWATEAP